MDRVVLLGALTLLFCSLTSTVVDAAVAAALPVAEEVLRPGFRLFPRAQQSESSAIFFRDLLLPTTTYSIYQVPDTILSSVGAAASNFVQPVPETAPFDTNKWIEVLRVRGADGKAYVCRRPPAHETSGSHGLSSHPAPVQNATVDIDELLYRRLADKCFYRQEGWWVFEFCFRRHVRHFHWERRRTNPEGQERVRQELAALPNQRSFPEGANGEAGRKRFLRLLLQTHHIPEDGSIDLLMKDEVCMGYYDEALDQEMKRNGTTPFNFTLNHSEPSSTSGERIENHHPMTSHPTVPEQSSSSDGRTLHGLDGLASATFLIQPYTKNGDLCDVTGRPRHTKVLYRCIEDVPGFAVAFHASAGASFIASVQELSTCEYELVFVTDAICMHPDFGSVARRSVPIVCEMEQSTATSVDHR
jgi:hypothetical protein